jgi:hypothetical protein
MSFKQKAEEIKLQEYSNAANTEVINAAAAGVVQSVIELPRLYEFKTKTSRAIKYVYVGKARAGGEQALAEASTTEVPEGFISDGYISFQNDNGSEVYSVFKAKEEPVVQVVEDIKSTDEVQQPRRREHRHQNLAKPLNGDLVSNQLVYNQHPGDAAQANMLSQFQPAVSVSQKKKSEGKFKSFDPLKKFKKSKKTNGEAKSPELIVQAAQI